MDKSSQLARNIAAAMQDHLFDDEHADFVLLSSGEEPTLFKVHKRQLAASSVFSDMLDVGAGSNDAIPADELFCGLPVIQVTENSEAMRHFLRFFPNDIDSFPDIASLNWQTTIDVWEACIKYDIALAQALVEAQLSVDLWVGARGPLTPTSCSFPSSRLSP